MSASVHIHVHELRGCAPEPLAAYLKALGVLRLVASQGDRSARGWWRGSSFFLATALDDDGLLGFFLRQYCPTPLVTPWNGGSGFYAKDKTDGIDAIANGQAARFAAYRDTIKQAKQLVAAMVKAPKDADVPKEAPKKDAKAALIRACRNHWRGPVQDWLDAALVITGASEVRYPALLGTGGNDGRLDFANNQMQRLVELISPATGEPTASAASLLRTALFGGVASGLISKAIGQFLPGAAGGANATAGFKGDSLFNPWDFVLMLEGALVLRVAAVRRLHSNDLGQVAAPFAVMSQAGGYASASAADESVRGEQWMPLWPRPAGFDEVRALFAEGRLQSGRQRARRALDAARAVARVGTARGVAGFVRYGFVERNGQAHLAVPLGRWQVPSESNRHVHLLDEIDGWVAALRRASDRDGAPAALSRTARAIERAMFAVCHQGNRAALWATLLWELGQAEDQLVARPRSTASLQLRPLPLLSLDWLDATYDNSVEWRLAAALASQYAADKQYGLGPIRVHCLPLATQGTRVIGRFATTVEGLARDRRVVWTGRDLVTDLGAVAARRLLDCRQCRVASFELRGNYPAQLDDIALFLAGSVDEKRLAGMARALMAMRWATARQRGQALPGVRWPRRQGQSLPLYGLFRLLYRPVGVIDRRETAVVLDPAPLRLLRAGRLDDATRVALRRVRLDIGRPKIHRAVGTPDQARRLAASLCFPLNAAGYSRLRYDLCYGEAHIVSEPRDDLAFPDEP